MFCAVVEAGSFTAAAARIGTSSGQASKLVSRLEAVLGVRLLSRTTRAVAPTEAGLAYYDRLRVLLDEFDALDAAVRDASGAPRGRLRLSAPLSFGTQILVPALNDFAVQFPGIELDVSFSDRLVSLVDEGFDLAIRVGHPGDSGMIARKICDMRLQIVAAPRYLAGHGAPETPEDLARLDCIIDTNMRDPTRWQIRDSDGQPAAVVVSGRIRYSNAQACLMAAEAGLGLACVPGFIAGPALRTGRVQQVLRAHESRPYGVHALYPHRGYLAGKTRSLVEFLIERFQGVPPWEVN